MARCILDSADKTHLSRVLSEAPWREEAINHRRTRFMLTRRTPIAVAAASRSSSLMRRCASMWAVSLTMWTGTTTTAMDPIRWPTIR